MSFFSRATFCCFADVLRREVGGTGGEGGERIQPAHFYYVVRIVLVTLTPISAVSVVQPLLFGKESGTRWSLVPPWRGKRFFFFCYSALGIVQSARSTHSSAFLYGPAFWLLRTLYVLHMSNWFLAGAYIYIYVDIVDRRIHPVCLYGTHA